MKTLYDINDMLHGLFDLTRELTIDFVNPRPESKNTVGNIRKLISLYHNVKYIIENNTPEDAENIIIDKRKELIDDDNALKDRTDKHQAFILIKHLDFIEYIRILNWTLDRDEFDFTY
jgi:hypothetical protein